jgi:hypothetical protein
MSIVDDFAAIGGRLAEIEKIPAKDVESAPVDETFQLYGGYIALPVPEVRMAGPVVWTPEQGYGSADTAPGELAAFKTIEYLYDSDRGMSPMVSSKVYYSESAKRLVSWTKYRAPVEPMKFVDHGAYDAPKVLTLSEVDPSADFVIYVAPDTDCA